MGRAESTIPFRDPDTNVAIGNLIVVAKDREGRAFIYELRDKSGHFITAGVVPVAVDFPVNPNADMVAHGLQQQIHKDLVVAAVSGQVSTTSVSNDGEIESRSNADYERDATLDAAERDYRYRMLVEALTMFEAPEIEEMDLGLETELGLDLAISFIE